MTKKEFAEIIKKITLAYGERFQVSDEKLDLWWQFFGEANKELLNSATMDYIGENIYPPTIADLKQIYSTKVQKRTAQKQKIHQSFLSLLGTCPHSADDLTQVKIIFDEYINSKPDAERYSEAEKIRRRMREYVSRVEDNDTKIEPMTVILRKIINNKKADEV